MDTRPLRPSDAWEALFRAQVSIMRELRADFVGVGISMNEYDVLFNVFRAHGHSLRLRDLNRNVLITQSSVSRLVDRLVARGLMTKCEDPFDARGAVVSLTDEALAEFYRAARVHTRSIDERIGRALSPREQAKLHELCLRLLDAQDEDDAAEAPDRDAAGRGERDAR